MKKCFKCNIKKDINLFYNHKGMKDGHLNKCIDCTKKDIKVFSKKPIGLLKNYDEYRQKYSLKRIISHRYNGIIYRCSKIHPKNGIKKSVYGKSFLSKEEWKEWVYQEDNLKILKDLHENFIKNNFDKRLSPSIDRIDNSKGYTKENLRWITLSENCKKYNK